MSSPPEALRYQPLTEADLDWAWKVYDATTREHLEQAVDLTEPEQRERRRAGLAGGAFEAIADGTGCRIGLREVTDDGAELTIRHLELLPEHQGSGLGTAVIADVVTRARAAQQAVVLRVMHVNPRARALYERLGFEVEEERSRTVQMRLDPRTSRTSLPPHVSDPTLGVPR